MKVRERGGQEDFATNNLDTGDPKKEIYFRLVGPGPWSVCPGQVRLIASPPCTTDGISSAAPHKSPGQSLGSTHCFVTIFGVKTNPYFFFEIRLEIASCSGNKIIPIAL